jgi:peptidyl-prolyl cis-trans isomerase A (cyclophilin A)
VCAVLQLEPKPVPRDRGDVVINMETTKGTFEVTVKPSWSPRGAAQFLALARKGFYDGCSVFRVVRGFVAQFGISGDPVVQRKYALASIPDDPPKPGVSNRFGTLSFASHGANSRGTQVFFNLMNNARLDGMGFTPFAVVAPAKMGVPVAFSAQYGEKPDQGQLEARGRAYLDENFPGLDMITRVQAPPPGAGEAQMPTAVVPEGDDRMVTHINGAMPDQAAPGSRSRSGSGSGSGSDWTSLEATYTRGAGSWAGSSASRSGGGSRGGDKVSGACAKRSEQRDRDGLSMDAVAGGGLGEAGDWDRGDKLGG